MGAGNSVGIDIDLGRTNSYYFAGEVISGTVNIKIKEGHIKVDEIFILLTGEAGYVTKRTVQNTNGAVVRVDTYHHNKSFLNVKKLLVSPESGQKELVYNTGDYSWRFEIPLPVQLPPSINQPNKYPHVRYYLKLVIDKPWYKTNTNEILYLTIFPQVNLMHNPQYLMAVSFDNHNRKDITLKGSINKQGYIPGETVTGTLEIENPRRILLKKVHLSLVQQTQIEPNPHQEIIFETNLPTLDGRNDERIMEKFSLAIPPSQLAPSYSFCGGFGHTVTVSVNYCLKFDVKVEGMFTNFDAIAPIILGTESDAKSNQHQLDQTRNFSPYTHSFYPQINADDSTPSPPSYDSIS
jgi:hypothetical protein